MQIIYANPRYEYPSYRDLYALINVSGFKTCFIDEIDLDSDNYYIVTILNGEYWTNRQFVGKWANCKDKRCKIILQDLERRDQFDDVRCILDGDMFNWYWPIDLEAHKRVEHSKSDYVILGSHPDLADGDTNHKVHDVTMLCAKAPRRDQIIRELPRRFKVMPERPFGKLSETKMMLYIHQDEQLYHTPIRFAVAAANRMLLIGEQLWDESIYDKGYVKLDINRTVRHLKSFLASGNDRNLNLHTEDMYQYLCVDNRFDIVVKNRIAQYDTLI